MEEIIGICANTLFEDSKKVEGLSKIEFKELLFLATKKFNFISNGKLYKQIHEVSMVSPLGLTLVDAFTAHFKKIWLQNCPSDIKPYYYRRHVDDIFILFTSPQHLEAFRNFLNGRDANMFFTIESEEQNRISFPYHLPIMLKLFTHSLIDAYNFAQVGLNWIMN